MKRFLFLPLLALMLVSGGTVVRAAGAEDEIRGVVTDREGSPVEGVVVRRTAVAVTVWSETTMPSWYSIRCRRSMPSMLRRGIRRSIRLWTMNARVTTLR